MVHAVRIFRLEIIRECVELLEDAAAGILHSIVQGHNAREQIGESEQYRILFRVFPFGGLVLKVGAPCSPVVLHGAVRSDAFNPGEGEVGTYAVDTREPVRRRVGLGSGWRGGGSDVEETFNAFTATPAWVQAQRRAGHGVTNRRLPRHRHRGGG